jgi:ATP-dependent Clp protease protease subunit
MKNHEEEEEEHASSFVTVSGDHIWFYGEVSERSAVALNRAVHDLSLKLAPTVFSSMQEVGSPAPIYLHINSTGGDLFSSLSIADTIERVSSLTPVLTIVEGCAASGATLISTAGSKRYMRKHAFMLIHELRAGTWGKYSELKESVKNYDSIMKTMKGWYSERTKLPEKELDQILVKDVWWNSKQCLKYGLIDQII